MILRVGTGNTGNCQTAWFVFGGSPRLDMDSHKKSPLMSKTLEVNYSTHKKQKSIKWGSINAVLFAVLIYDIKFKCPYYTTTFHYIEYVLTIIFGLNTLYHCICYLYYAFTTSPVLVTPNQRKLLGFKDNDTSFKYKSPEKQKAVVNNRSPSPPINLSTRSWLSGSSMNESMNQSMSSSSWAYTRGSPVSPMYQSNSLDFGRQSDPVMDEHSLQEYLRTMEEKEKVANLNNSLDNSPKDVNVFWNHPSMLTVKDVTPMFKRTQYQLAPLNCEIPHMHGAHEEGSPKSHHSSPQLWHKLHLDPQHLVQWNANLRKWISTTILDRVVKEIKQIDDSLLKCGLADVRVGHVGLDRLKKIAQTTQIMQQVPTLSMLMPFMEISTNQEYLVQRIKELSSGGCMSDFKWNGGGNLHGKSWDESLPTDSAIIMHFFATYLDTQLMPVTQNPEGLPFTSQHFCKVPEKPMKTADTLKIHQTSIMPPHFLLIIGEETCEVAKGRNNLIHTILLFLHTVATKYHGMLGRVNLGKSGVNVLWVIDQ